MAAVTSVPLSPPDCRSLRVWPGMAVPLVSAVWVEACAPGGIEVVCAGARDRLAEDLVVGGPGVLGGGEAALVDAHERGLGDLRLAVTRGPRQAQPLACGRERERVGAGLAGALGGVGRGGHDRLALLDAAALEIV